MKIRCRWDAPPDARRPMHGDYLMSARGRGGYLIRKLAQRNRDKLVQRSRAAARRAG